jgi:hypothetical protein|tara:strand:+ start:1760 stop:1975 length:216 start_codon:yes stop_codon:yes gene_type:complete
MTHTAESIYRRNCKLKWEYNDNSNGWTAVTEDGNGICIAFKDPLDYENCGKQAEVLNRFNEMHKRNRSKRK